MGDDFAGNTAKQEFFAPGKAMNGIQLNPGKALLRRDDCSCLRCRWMGAGHRPGGKPVHLLLMRIVYTGFILWTGGDGLLDCKRIQTKEKFHEITKLQIQTKGAIHGNAEG
jgi:hypothetical protein